MKSSTVVATTEELVRNFGVCFRLRTEFVRVWEETLEVALQLELTGGHEGKNTRHAEFRCSQCRAVLLALLDIADSILPRERFSRKKTAAVQKRLCYTSARNREGELVLTMSIIGRKSLDSYSGEDWWLQLLVEVTSALQAIGCQQLSWQSNNAAYVPSSALHGIQPTPDQAADRTQGA